MTREWKPGDVAMSAHAVTMRTTGGWAYSDGSVGGLHQDDYPRRPLVTIDPEDREDVERLTRKYDAAVIQMHDDPDPRDVTPEQRTTAMQAALREYADPKPVEVFEHFLHRTDGGTHKSVCGKTWRPSDDTVANLRCPECAAVVEAGWVK